MSFSGSIVKSKNFISIRNMNYTEIGYIKWKYPLFPLTKRGMIPAFPPLTKRRITLASHPLTKRRITLASPPLTKRGMVFAFPPLTKRGIMLGFPPLTKREMIFAFPPLTKRGQGVLSDIYPWNRISESINTTLLKAIIFILFLFYQYSLPLRMDISGQSQRTLKYLTAKRMSLHLRGINLRILYILILTEINSPTFINLNLTKLLILQALS
jgi:hypothetical protein